MTERSPLFAGAGRYRRTRGETGSPLHSSLVEARSGLCAALDALHAQTEGLVVVGSHAVHERTKDLGIISTATKDCDLAVLPSLVLDDPRLETAMRGAGFRPLGEFTDHPAHARFEHQPGLWGKGFDATGVPIAEVDLIVPQALSGGGRRAPRAMSHHGSKATRMAPGLELAAFDRDLLPIESFTDSSIREAYVAGYAALVCAKVHKIADRVAERGTGRRDRVSPKDGGDIWRLMAASDPQAVGATFRALVSHEIVGDVARAGLAHLRDLSTSRELLALARLDLEENTDAPDIEQTLTNWTAGLFGVVEQ